MFNSSVVTKYEMIILKIGALRYLERNVRVNEGL